MFWVFKIIGGIHSSLSPRYTQNVSVAVGLERYDDFLRRTVSLPRKSICMRFLEIEMLEDSYFVMFTAVLPERILVL